MIGYAKITPENGHMIKSCYEARKPVSAFLQLVISSPLLYNLFPSPQFVMPLKGELAVLIQYFDQNEVAAPLATHLDIILYSREQIIKENIAMCETPPNTDAPWGIIRQELLSTV